MRYHVGLDIYTTEAPNEAEFDAIVKSAGADIQGYPIWHRGNSKQVVWPLPAKNVEVLGDG